MDILFLTDDFSEINSWSAQLNTNEYKKVLPEPGWQEQDFRQALCDSCFLIWQLSYVLPINIDSWIHLLNENKVPVLLIVGEKDQPLFSQLNQLGFNRILSNDSPSFLQQHILQDFLRTAQTPCTEELLKSAELRVKESEEKFRALFELSPIGIAYHRMIYTDDGEPYDYEFIDANDHFIEFTGVDPRGKSVREAFPGIEKDPADWIGTFGNIAKNGGSIQFQQFLATSKRWYDVVAFQTNKDHFVASFIEITDQKKTEEELRQAQKMDAIGQLAGGVAHDFNNMLSGVLGGVEILEMSQEQTEESLNALGIIKEASERAAELTSQLLLFSRKSLPQAKPIDIHSSILGAIGLLEHSIDKKVKIRKILNAEKAVILGDLSQIQNALLNLGINSGQAMPDGGDIFFITQNIEVDKAYLEENQLDIAEGFYIEIRVEDSGEGIPPENIQKVFDPFFTTKEKGKGTGLGLSAVYGAIQQHKGDLKLSSTLGKGTQFLILLPLCDVPVEFAPNVESRQKGEGTILLVDDEPIIRRTTAIFLKEMGYSVLTAENGLEALQIFKNHLGEIDLVLLDMIMPEMDGKQCFYLLRDINPQLPVIVISGFSPENDIEEMFSNGLSGFLAKPFSSIELGRLVSENIN